MKKLILLALFFSSPFLIGGALNHQRSFSFLAPSSHLPTKTRLLWGPASDRPEATVPLLPPPGAPQNIDEPDNTSVPVAHHPQARPSRTSLVPEKLLSQVTVIIGVSPEGKFIERGRRTIMAASLDGILTQLKIDPNSGIEIRHWDPELAELGLVGEFNWYKIPLDNIPDNLFGREGHEIRIILPGDGDIEKKNSLLHRILGSAL